MLVRQSDFPQGVIMLDTNCCKCLVHNFLDYVHLTASTFWQATLSNCSSHRPPFSTSSSYSTRHLAVITHTSKASPLPLLGSRTAHYRLAKLEGCALSGLDTNWWTRHHKFLIEPGPLGSTLGKIDSFIQENRMLNQEETFLTVKVPPVEVNVPPRVEHIVAPWEGSASEVLSRCLVLPSWFIKELIRFGAVYSCPVHPLPPRSTSPTVQQLNEVNKIRRESIKKFGRNAIHQQPKRLTTDCILPENSYVRVHVHPKRFPAFYQYDWAERIIYNGEGCVVVNKPPGCQVCSRVDNSLESVCAWVTGELDLQDELMTTHRLDMGTEGVVVLAKTKDFASYFNRIICKKDKVTKIYRALTESPPNVVGRLIHRVMVGQRSPGEPAHTVICDRDEPTSLYAELVVLKVDSIKLTGRAKEMWGSSGYETLIELKTGRTHQIRAQLAAIGAPILGDNLYKAVSEIKNYVHSEDGSIRDSITCHVSKPKLSYEAGQCDCIGLQASRLEIHDSQAPDYVGKVSPVLFEAGTPWWRNQAKL